MKARAVSRWAFVALALGTVFLAVAVVAHQARAQAYKYKDQNGHVHFTEDYYQIPERFRKQVETRDMPVHVDPNAPAEQRPEAGTAEASFEDSVRQGMGGNLTSKQEEALHDWMKRWMWPAIIGFVINWIIALSMVIHAFVQGRIGWGLANFFIGLTSPFYLMIHLEQSAMVRLGLVLLYIAPMVICGMAGADLASALH